MTAQHLLPFPWFDLLLILALVGINGILSMGELAVVSSREARLKEFTKGQPLARAGDPDEAAQAYLYLMRAGFTTGQVLKVDGGMSVV